MRKTVKKVVRLFITLLLSPLILLYFIGCIFLSKDSLFATFAQFLSLFPGITGSYIRVNFFKFVMNKCSSNSRISFATLFSQVDTEIEEGVYIGPQCNIGACKIEKDCLLGSGVHIMSGKGQHNFNDLDTPIREQGGTFKKVTIGEDTWIGNGALIMANVGKKCIIAAGSVVVDDVEDYSIIGGNPAKLIRKRQ